MTYFHYVYINLFSKNHKNNVYSGYILIYMTDQVKSLMCLLLNGKQHREHLEINPPFMGQKLMDQILSI